MARSLEQSSLVAGLTSKHIKAKPVVPKPAEALCGRAVRGPDVQGKAIRPAHVWHTKSAFARHKRYLGHERGPNGRVGDTESVQDVSTGLQFNRILLRPLVASSSSTCRFVSPERFLHSCYASNNASMQNFVRYWVVRLRMRPTAVSAFEDRGKSVPSPCAVTLIPQHTAAGERSKSHSTWKNFAGTEPNYWQGL